MIRDVSKDSKFNPLEWVRTTKSGDEIIYHIGEYCAGRHRQTIYSLSETGHVVLFQRRAPGRDGDFTYHARRTRK